MYGGNKTYNRKTIIARGLEVGAKINTTIVFRQLDSICPKHNVVAECLPFFSFNAIYQKLIIRIIEFALPIAIALAR